MIDLSIYFSIKDRKGFRPEFRPSPLLSLLEIGQALKKIKKKYLIFTGFQLEIGIKNPYFEIKTNKNQKKFLIFI